MAGKKTFNELHFTDAFMFAAAMEDEEICRGVLERVLEMPIRHVRVHVEKSLFVNSDYRGVRMDVYADHEDGTAFNVEMQTTDKGNLPRRSRMYQGQMDMVALKPGERFEQLPDSFVIFICTYDPFGQELYRYTFDSRCKETGEPIGDGAMRIFLNTKGKHPEMVSPELVRFLKYIEDAAPEEGEGPDELIDQIETRIASLKRERGMEVNYMLFSEMLDDERMEGRAEGRTEGEDRIARLNLFLLDESRYEDLKRASQDKEYREHLLESMGI